MSQAANSSRPSRLRKLGLVTVGLVVVLGVALMVTYLVGRSRLAAATGSWTAAGMDLEQFVADRPPREANASALKAEDLAWAVGISLAPKSSGRVRSKEEDRPNEQARRRPADALKEPMQVATDWLQAALKEEDDTRIPAAPEILTAWFETEATAWTALREHLARREIPLWEQDLTRGVDVQVPNLLGCIRVARLLLAEALIAGRAGRHEEAAQALEASWTLTRSLSEHVVVITQLVRIAIAKQQAAVVRRLPGLDAELWRKRLEGRSLVKDLSGSHEAEAALTAQTLRSGGSSSQGLGMESRWPASWLVPILAPGGAASHLEYELRTVESIGAAQGCPALDEAEESFAKMDETWNPVARYLAYDHTSILARAILGQMQDELTVKVLEARASGGVVPPEWSRSACEKSHYELTPGPGGGFRVSLVEDHANEVLARLTSNFQPLATSYLVPAS